MRLTCVFAFHLRLINKIFVFRAFINSTFFEYFFPIYFMLQLFDVFETKLKKHRWQINSESLRPK